MTKILGRPEAECVPILTYHSISINLFGHSHPYYQINTTPEVFSEQMHWLKNAGYRSIDLTELLSQPSSSEDMRKRLLLPLMMDIAISTPKA